MSGILNSTLKGSNSNFQDASGRTFPTSFAAQSGFSGAALNEPGTGNMQGIQNIHGGYNMSTMPGPYASRNAATISGLQNGVQQAQGSVPNGRYAMNNLPNAHSQLSRGASHGHTGIQNTGGQGVLPNVGNTGRIANPIVGPVGGDSSGRGSTSANVANIPGLASRLNMNDFSAPQMVSMHGNAYSGAGVPLTQNQYQAGAGVPLTQNQYQAGNNQFSYMSTLNDPNTPEGGSLDLSDFPQLSARPNSTGGSQGHLGLMQKHNISYNHRNQEFSMQSEDFPALSGYKGGIIGNGAEYGINTPQNDQLHDMSNMMQSQPLPVGRSSGYNYGASYPSHHHQQHPSSSINGGGVSYLPSGSQDVHFQGPEQYQHFQMPPQSGFTNPNPNPNPYRGNEMNSSLFQYPIVPDKYGLLGLLKSVTSVSPSWTSRALGIDLTTLGMNLNSPEILHKKFASPWTDDPVRGEPEYAVPDCYYAKEPPRLTKSHFAKFRIETLLYIFYSMPKDEAQLYAANELCNRGWFYHRELRVWFMRVKGVEPPVNNSTHERGCYYIFDPNKWQTIRKDNYVLQYDMIENRPVLPQR